MSLFRPETPPDRANSKQTPIPESPSVPVSDPALKSAAETRGKSEDVARLKQLRAELAPMEEQEEAEAAREFARSLADLYHYLGKQATLKASEVMKLIELTDLATLAPVPKRDLAQAIAAGRLNEKPLDEFLEETLGVLRINIFTEGLKRATNTYLANKYGSDATH